MGFVAWRSTAKASRETVIRIQTCPHSELKTGCDSNGVTERERERERERGERGREREIEREGERERERVKYCFKLV